MFDEHDGGGGGDGDRFSTTRGRGCSREAFLRCRSQGPKVQRLYIEGHVCTLSAIGRSEEMALQNTTVHDYVEVSV